MYEQIAKELIDLAQHDLDVREKLLEEKKLSPGYNPEMEKVHKRNVSRLQEIIDLIGWPTKSKVGDEGSQAAWLIVQHSIGDPVFMKKCYSLMQESINDINPQNVAYLHDRICYFEGRPQKFGTQYDNDILYPVDNKSELNERREKMQVKPLPLDEVSGIKQSKNLKDLHKDPDFNTWRRRTGWI